MARTNDVCGHLDRPCAARGLCVACYKKHLKATNPDYAARQSAGSRSWRENNRERHRANTRRWRQANPDRIRELNRKHNGLPNPTRPTPPVCECCSKPCKTKTVLCLDHCHDTGAFRGWLCNACNVGIGRLGDNEEGLMKALEYLRRAKP